MTSDPTAPLRDPARVAALRGLALLDTPPEEAFDRLTRLAVRVLDVPVALVSLVDEERQFFKSVVGLPEPWASRRETPLSHSFCQYAVASREPLVIEDAREHPLVRDSLAIPDLGVVAYAGIPLVTAEGHVLGSFCAIDAKPRRWTEEELAILADLAGAATTAIALRATAQVAERERREKAALVESTAEGIYGTDLDGRCTFINPAAAAMLGFAPDEVLGRDMHALIHHTRPDGSAYPKAECPIARACVGGTAARRDEELLWRKDGTPFPAEYSCAPVVAEGRVTGAVVTFLDVTERKRAEAELRESRRFLRSALDALSAHIAILDETGTIVAVNAAWQRFTGVNGLSGGDHGEGTNYLALCDSTSGPCSSEARAVATGIRAVMEGRQDEVRVEYACHTPAERRWFVARVTRFGGEGPIRVVVAHEDITERKLAEEERARTLSREQAARAEAEAAEARYRELFEASADAILAVDAKGCYLDANPAMTELVGYTRSELREMRLGDLPSGGREWSEPEFDCLRRDGHWAGEVELRRKDGTEVPVEVRAQRITLPQGTGFLMTLRDISERRALDRLQSEFLAMVTHDLKSPLTSIKGYAQLLRRRGHAERESGMIVAQANRMERLIGDLMDVASLEAGRLDLDPTDVDLVGVVRLAVEQFEATTETHRIRAELPHGPLVGRWDPDRVAQVLQNLLSNAIKYSPEGGEIVVRVEGDGQAARVSVTDCGVGIPQEELPKLFRRFYRVGANAGRAPGLGLGLFISRTLVEAHGGRIWAESTLGQGSTFSVSLPLARSEDE